MLKGNTKKIIVLIMMIVAIIVIIAGVSFAVWRSTVLNGGKNTISTEAVSLELLESGTDIISLNNALPMTDQEGIDQDEEFTFAVTTNTRRNTTMNYSIVLTKLDVDSGYTALNDSDIKVYLEDYEMNQLVAPTLVSNLTNYVIYQDSHAHTVSNQKVTSKYRLRTWIDNSKATEAASWDTTTKKGYKFKITVNS